MAKTEKIRRAETNRPTQTVEGFTYTKVRAKEITFSDLVVVAIIAANLINPDIWSWWWLIIIPLWARTYTSLSDLVDNTRRYNKAREIQKQILKEIDDQDPDK